MMCMKTKTLLRICSYYVCVIFSRKSSTIALGGGNMIETSATLMDELKSQEDPISKIHPRVEKGRYSCIDKRLAVALQWFRTGALIRVPRHQLHRGRFVDLFPTRCPAE